MKPERALAVMQKQKIIKDADKELKSLLRKKEIKPPTLFEYKTPRQRYEGLQILVLSMIRNPRPYGTPHTQGSTPNVEIPVSKGGEEIPLRLKFEASEDETESNLSAVWTSVDKSSGLPPLREGVSEELAIQARVYPNDYRQVFTNFEWSLVKYLETVSGFSEQQLRQHRFPKDFSDKILSA